ncbi:MULTISPECIES: hypothetical protein [Rhodanobacter]|uniref:hypothetical protein n=1 Tax=Rhodanobacter TaxID=75309 RepID=UPI0012DD3325|nr:MULTISPECIES: hypothetical protein [Rhodanobacter]UJJ50986.1 hypothetical protein LRK52_17385 [Rhodanobacter denitrificans]UJM93699.1 hypothetical protein LRK32_17285 [Rhodanobacter denitrificans]UJM97230.1 hypothetical protein LRK44_17295 [Rhodanobacter denitrificans]UJN19942.1 hypothetical protein LRK54_09340 [Rhodanobacter denitrificans]
MIAVPCQFHGIFCARSAILFLKLTFRQRQDGFQQARLLTCIYGLRTAKLSNHLFSKHLIPSNELIELGLAGKSPAIRRIRLAQAAALEVQIGVT